ncbi:uncharacterized protein METZ01_LOCUS305704, partial [marine metagenome]
GRWNTLNLPRPPSPLTRLAKPAI